MAAASTCTPPQRLSTSSTVDDAQKRVPSKRMPHHHHHPGAHFRPPTKSTERQRKIKRRPVNFVSTDGTTSGEGDDIQYSSELDIQARLEQLLRRPDQSDLEADCEDNNSTDVDTVSISGSIKHKNPIDNENSNPTDTKVELLCAKIRNLEKQLATVLSINIKLKEENDRLKNSVGQQ